MIKWQRRARLLIALFAVVFMVIVAFAFKRRAPAPVPAAVARMDPKAVVESTGGTATRFKGTREDVSIAYQRLVTYADGSTKMIGVAVNTAGRGNGRSFTVTGAEGQVGKDEATYVLDGDVKLVASDGLTATAAHATYAESDGVVRAPGAVVFSRGRISGNGIGMTYDSNRDAMSLLDQPVIRVAPDDKGAGGAEITAGTAEFARRDRQVRLERAVKVIRSGQVIEADAATAFLSDDDQRVDRLELRGNSRIVGSNPGAGGLQSLTGGDMNLQYAADGEALQHALIVGNASIQLAGESGKAGSQIAANVIDVALEPDGTTPGALAGREAVRLTFPPEQGGSAQSIRAATIDAAGEPGRGLTRARFADDVEYREAGKRGDRVAKSAILEIGLKPGMSAIDEAKFRRSVRFTDDTTRATAAEARYVPEQGLLELGGSEPATAAPHVVNDQISVDATRIDLVFDGPKMKATGNVRSVLQPGQPGSEKQAVTKMPSMLKNDQPVNVTAESLDYDGSISKATYTGNAQLWQADTSIRAETLVVDNQSGDLTGTGGVATNVVQEQANSDTKAKERVRTVGSARDFHFEDARRLATYTTDAHLSGLQGDMTATRIELYLKESGGEVDRIEGYDADNKMALRETGRRTTGNRLTYFAADQRYVVTGAPVTVIDECARETIARTLIFFKATDTILVDGDRQIRTQTKGGEKCPGS